MENNNGDKYETVNIISNINEIMGQTEIIQYYKNSSNSPIELLMEIPELNNCSLTKFEMTLNNRKVISKILEKEKAKEKYNDSISTGNESLVSYINDDGKNIKICLGNIPPNQEVELKTY